VKSAGIGKEEFETLFDDHYAAVRNYIYYRSGNVDEAEDIAQETFIKVWEKRETIRLSTVKALLYTIAGNIFANRFQHRKVEMKFTSTYIENQTYLSPEYQLEMKEFDQALQKAISDLSEKSRIVFLMSRIDDMSYSEISQRLGIGVKAVEKRMHKALSYFSKELGKKI
jgi:RNA polymerase sigma-70 factor (ECF subfamily)